MSANEETTSLLGKGIEVAGLSTSQQRVCQGFAIRVGQEKAWCLLESGPQRLRACHDESDAKCSHCNRKTAIPSRIHLLGVHSDLL
jgi:hypothetical protein